MKPTASWRPVKPAGRWLSSWNELPWCGWADSVEREHNDGIGMAARSTRRGAGWALPHIRAAAATAAVRRTAATADAGAVRRRMDRRERSIVLLQEPGRYPVAYFPKG